MQDPADQGVYARVDEVVNLVRRKVAVLALPSEEVVEAEEGE